MNPSDYGLELKFSRGSPLKADEMVLEGYASLFGLADQGGDIVQRGAYAASLGRLGASGLRRATPTMPALSRSRSRFAVRDCDPLRLATSRSGAER